MAKVGEKAAKFHKNNALDRRRLEEIRKTGRPPLYVSAELFAYRLAAYIVECERQANANGESRPMTVAGACVALKVWPDMFSEYRKGDNDHINDCYQVEEDGGYIEDHPRAKDEQALSAYIHSNDSRLKEIHDYLTADHIPCGANTTILYFSDVTKRFDTFMQAQAEERLYIKGRVADIFTMKARYKWQEEESRTITHRLEIATEEEAKQALKELYHLEG